jgi:hypothetical protein
MNEQIATNRIEHKFLDHKIDPQTETLIIGTFNPKDSATLSNDADFFYSRGSHLWKILPKAFDKESLKGNTKNEKMDFIRANHIDFIDLISAIEGSPVDFKDSYLDSAKKIEWRNVIEEIKQLHFLQRACITHKTFKDVPNINIEVKKIEAYFADKKEIVFRCLHTPARYYSEKIQAEWTDFLRSKPA